MGTAVDKKPNTMVLTTSGYMPYSQAQSAGLAYQDVQAVSDAMASDARLSQLENNVPSNVTFTVDDYLKGIDASDGISQDETKLAFDLLSSGAVTVADLEAKTGIPASAIQSTYDTLAAAKAAQDEADLAAEIAAADAEERRVTGSLNEFGETYAEEQARLALQRSAESDARMKQNAADAEAAALAEEAAARQAAESEEAAQAAANSPEAAETQRKDDDFDAKVNAAGGVTPGTIDKVIDIALEVYGDNSRGVVKVVSESLKGGVTMKDLEEATDLSGDEILAAAKTAANDPNKSLTPGEILSGAANTVYDITNKVVDIVETGLEVTGIEKVIDTIGNTVAKIGGLDPSQTKKVLVVNPVTGQITVQASNQPGGGILGNLPQSPYVPIGNTSGGTTYGVDAENAIINVVLGKVITNGGLDKTDTTSVIGAAVEETTGIPMEAAVGVINSAGDLVKGAVKTVKDSGILSGSGNRQDDEEAATTGFEVITGGTENDTITGGDDNTTITGGTGNDTITGGEGDDTITAGTGATLSLNNQTDVVCGKNQYKDFVTGQCVDIPCPAGQERNKNGDCYTPGVGDRTTVDEDLTVADITANTPCDTPGEVRDPVTLVCGKPTGTTTGTTTGGGGTDKIVCPDTYNNAGAKVDSLDECGGLKSTSTVVNEDDDKTVVVDGVTNVVNYVCKEEGAVYNPETQRCEKTNTTTLDTTFKEEVVCSDPDAVYDATLNNGQGGCYKINKTSLATSDTREEVVCSDPDAIYDATLNNGQGGCYKTTTRTIDGANTLTQTICETGTWDETLQKCVNTVTGNVINKTVCDDGSEPDANGNCIVTTIGNVINKTVCDEGVLDPVTNKCVNTVTGNVINKTVCDDGSEPDANGNCLVTTTLDTTTTTLCSDGKPPDPETGCARTVYMDVTTNTICPEGSYKGDDNRCYNDVTGEVVQNTICPAGTTYNETTKQCEYSKYFCPPGFTFNILTSQCEPDTEEEEGTTGGLPTVQPPSLGLANRGDFVDRGDVLVENTGEMGGIYSILPAPIREPFLAGNRQQDIRNVADVVGIRQGEDFNQDPEAVQRFARYANAFDIGVPELLDISGVLPSDVPLYEQKFDVTFPVQGIAPPVKPEEPIAEERYTPDLSVFKDGGVVKSENGIEGLLERRQQAVNRMLLKRAGSHFGR